MQRFSQQQLQLIRQAVLHYLQYQIGVHSPQHTDYEVILRLLENTEENDSDN